MSPLLVFLGNCVSLESLSLPAIKLVHCPLFRWNAHSDQMNPNKSPQGNGDTNGLFRDGLQGAGPGSTAWLVVY